jgi:ATP-dependent helicase Lhr and Lhr-like helicase
VESVPGGFSAIYPVLKAMEESGRIRRGYFVAGFGATQFGSAGSLDLLRSYRDEPDEPETVMLAATDPANPYGALLKWPTPGLMRVPGASVILVNGLLGAYVGRGEKQLSVFLPEDEPMRGTVAREIARMLASLVTNGLRRALLIAQINDAPAAKSDLGSYLAEAGFAATAMGYQMRALR